MEIILIFYSTNYCQTVHMYTVAKKVYFDRPTACPSMLVFGKLKSTSPVTRCVVSATRT